MIDLIGRSFKNGRGEILTVIDVDSDIAILADDQRISINRLLDDKHYRPAGRVTVPITSKANENASFNSDQAPDIFGNSNNRYGNLLNQIRNQVDKNPFGMESGSDHSLTSFRMVEPTVELGNTEMSFNNDENSIEEAKRRMIENQKRLRESIEKQSQSVSKYLDDEAVQPNLPTYEEADRTVSLVEYDNNNRQVESANINESSFLRKDNPAYQMFRNVKRSVPFKMNLELSKLLPKKEFIQMWEESYEISMIEYLAEEFLRELLNNPENLKIQIISKMNEQIFPKKSVVKKTPAKKKAIKQPSAKKESANDNDK